MNLLDVRSLFNFIIVFVFGALVVLFINVVVRLMFIILICKGALVVIWVIYIIVDL